jgi:cell division protein FtsZ
MTINLRVPDVTELKPRITVFGVGGAGGNAVSNMIEANLEGVEFVIANTDAQALSQSRAERRIQMGSGITEGLGAGSRPEIGAAAAEESLPEIIEHLQGSHMVFITGGMGGGTGTGAAPVIARAAREQGILTVGVVTKPFNFEGARRMRVADGGITELQKYADTLIVIPNQNLFRIANEKTTFAAAFSMADEVLHSGVRGITDLMVMPGLINLDFADVRTVMNEMGKAMMGTGEAEGETRAIDAAEAAINNPLLDEVSMKGARGVLINITGGMDLTLYEVDEAANRIRAEVDPEANIIVGSTFAQELDGRMRVSVVATGIASEEADLSTPLGGQDPGFQRAPAQQPRQAPAQNWGGGDGGPQSSGYAPRPEHQGQPQRYEAPIQQAPAQPEPIDLQAAQAQPHPQADFDRGLQPRDPHEGPVAQEPAQVYEAGAPQQAGEADFSFTGSVKKMSIGFFDRVKGQNEPRGRGEPAPQAAPPAEPASRAPDPSEREPERESEAFDARAPRSRKTGESEGGDAQLDIPAFLRRQAN